jgi:nitroimidazol reductase NimA-like FMN-containing flavoprotein (pyridoxamine 5'-phosphate oxidase superfamily)
MTEKEKFLGSTTTTDENRMSPTEIDEFLRGPFIGRLATNRSDGFPHVTPVWPVWDGEAMHFALGEKRIHIRNVRTDPKATLIVDEDWRPRDKRYVSGAAAVVLRGTVTIMDLDASEKALPQMWTDHADKFLDGAVGDDDYWNTESSAGGERYHVCTLRPMKIVSWDFRKFHGVSG